MTRKIQSLAALIVLGLVAAWAATAGITHTTMPKQNTLGGDSLGTGPDTTDAIQLYANGTAFTVEVAVQDSTTYLIQLSPDGSTWFIWAALDTVDSGYVAQTADLGTKYRDWYLRVILDNLAASAMAYGRAFTTWEY